MSSRLYPYDHLFSPIRINRMTVKNRLVMAPMGNISMCEGTGRPKHQMIRYFIERAKGGVGLITSGLVPDQFWDRPFDHRTRQADLLPPDRPQPHRFAGWRDLAAGVHAYGAKFFIQLTPGLGRVGNPRA